ncbi:MAG: hypothetical protein ACR2H2_00985 [Solirubrobacteraceae bacterium]
MSDEHPRLTRDEVLALKFAVHRQLARWSDKPELSPHQYGQRNALKRAVRILQDKAFACGCELHAFTDEQRSDG